MCLKERNSMYNDYTSLDIFDSGHIVDMELILLHVRTIKRMFHNVVANNNFYSHKNHILT